jgi:hypothetical protein
MRRFPFLLLLLFLPASAFAWNAAGHRLVTGIAWREMDESTRHAATALLAEHPDTSRWQHRVQGSAATPESVFEEAASWPDEIRQDPRFHDAGKAPAGDVLAGFPDMERHGDWHFVDRVDGQRHGSIDHQIERLSDVLRQGARADRVYALPWLLHLVADIHQPLHVGDRADRGGNDVVVEVGGTSGPRRTNLHAYWDDLPGPPWLRGERLAMEITRLAPLEANDTDDAVGDWREESAGIAHADAYPAPASNALSQSITPEFAARAQAIKDQRIARAGHRLARLLKAMLAPVSRETREETDNKR